MVATHGHRRQSSSGGSSAGNSHRSDRRRPSYRRPSEAINAPHTAHPGRYSRTSYGPQRRAQSIAAGALQPPAPSYDRRRPSAPERNSTLNNNDKPRLSIADRFMSPNYQREPSPPPAAPPIITTTITPATTTTSTSPVVRSDSNPSSYTTGSLAERASLSPSASRDITSETSPDPKRLTIAETFMKRPSIASINPPESDVRPQSMLSTLGTSSDSKDLKPVDELHPLDTSARRESVFDSDVQLDLSFPSPNSAVNASRPFGSQETLVQTPVPSDKKQQSYAEMMETEKSRRLSEEGGGYSLTDDYYYNHHHPHDDSDGYGRSSFSTATRHGDYHYYEVGETKGNATDRWRSMSVQEEEDERPRGLWIGCCFLSCGQRPGDKALMKEEEERRRRRREKEEKDEEGGKRRKRCCGRRVWVFGGFLVLIAAIVAAYLVWPRTPLLRIEGASLLSAPQVTETNQGVMVGNVAFQSQWLVNVTVDNRENRVPTRLNRITVLVKDALTGLVIGKGLHDDEPASDALVTVLPAQTISTIQLPIAINYEARDDSDTTFASLEKACTPQASQTIYDSRTNQTITQQPEREQLLLHFWITLDIYALDVFGYKPTVIATPATGGFACPLS